jgi:predicted CXXCH cytochrome family protein
MGIPRCASCHNNHDVHESSDVMLGVDGKGVCQGCHTGQDNGGKTAAAMRESIERLRDDFDKARATLLNAEHAGMEVSQPIFELNGAKTALVKARAAIHVFDLQTVKNEVEPGLEIAKNARARGLKALDELQFRRKGLAISVLIILALIIALIIKIRRLEGKRL